MSEDCEKMQDKIADSIFGALSRQDDDALKQHLAVCPKCREYIKALRDEKGLLREFAEKVEAGMEPREERMAEAVKSCNLTERMKLPLLWKTIVQSRITKLTVAAALLIAAGYFAGLLLPARPADIQQLQAALEASLKSSLEQAIRQSLLEQVNRDRELALESHYAQLRDELTGQFHRDLNEFAVRILTTSRAATEQRLAELIQLIEAARTVDHLQFATAFEQIESNRLEDRARFGKGLARLIAEKKQGLPDN